MELWTCSLCLGCWVYTLLAAVFRVYVFSEILEYVPVLSEVLTGMVLSFLMWLISNGWDARFKIYHLEDD